MDLQKQFKDLDLNEENKIETKENVPATVAEEPVESDLDGDKIIKELEERLKKIDNQANTQSEDNDKEYEPLEQKTFLEKLQPFIIPICLTLFAIVFAGLFLYFFSKSRVENTAQAIINQGIPEQVYYPPPPVPITVIEEPLKCEDGFTLNEAGDSCIETATTTEDVVVPTKPAFEDGTTTVVHVRFSFDKFNYDNTPRGIFLKGEQIFDGEYENYKLIANNRAFANDYFFGIDRYTVSLIGSCSYVVDDAQILVKNMTEKDKYFTGVVAKVLDSSKPRVSCQ